MTDRTRYYDHREELRRVQRTVGHLVDAIHRLTNGQLEQRLESRRYHSQTRHIVFDGVSRIEKQVMP